MVVNRFKQLTSTLSKVGINAFFVGIVLTVLLAYFFPEYGLEESTLKLPTLSIYGVSFIFFFYGLRLSPEKLKSGLSNWKLHVVIQLSTFLLFPLVALGVLAFSNDNVLWTGFFFLAVLPSTVSSSVVMVSIANGNVPAAIFNASISSMFGIVLTPLWMSVYNFQAQGDMALAETMLKLTWQVALPVLLGMMLHRRLGDWVNRYTQQLRWGDQIVILLIVYTSFCESLHQRMFEGFSASTLLLLAASMLLFFLVVAAIMYSVSGLLKFSREDKITVVFCGSKKSLVQGAVMGRVIFANASSLGVVLLPLMLYHALQLMAGSILANAWKVKSEG